MNSEAVLPFVSNGCLTWTMTTNGYKYYTLNLIMSLRRANVPWDLCVICCDYESFMFFRREAIPCVEYEIEDNRGQTNVAFFGTNEFAKWNKKKLELLKWFADGGAGSASTLYLDGDIFIQRDPWPVLKEEFSSKGEDLLFQCDCVGDENHEGCGAICSGVIAMRQPSPQFSELYAFDEGEWAAADRQDQEYIRRRIKSLGIPFRTLRRELWGNGHWQMGMKWKGDPMWVLLHYNYRVGGTKKGAMRKFGHWILPY